MSRTFAVRIRIGLAAALFCAGAGTAGAQLPVPELADRCGTWRVAGVGPEAVAPSAARPPAGAFQEQSTHFIVHYGDAALSAYAADVAGAAEHGYRVLVDTLGYLAPPPDGAGGDDRIDIYVRSVADMGGAWGITFPETVTGSPYANSATSWIELVDTLSVPRRSTVTVHELFHTIHIGYDSAENVSLLEMISTWFEDRAYDGANIYLEVLPFFFDQPTKALFSHVYSNVPWAMYLTENFGDDIIRDILEFAAATPGSNARGSTDDALALRGTTTADEFTEFTLWNFFTGARDDGQHYAEGATWPLMFLRLRTDCLPVFDDRPLQKAGRLAAHYYVFDGNGSTDALRIRIRPEYDANTVLAAHAFIGGTVDTQAMSIPSASLSDSLTVSTWSAADSLLVIYMVDTSGSSSNDLILSAYFVEETPAALPYVLVLDRDDCRHPFDGVGDAFTERDGEEAPLTTALDEAGIRWLQSDSIPDDLSLCGGMFIAGGFGSSGVNLSDGELSRVMAFMDGGGDVYLESSRFGGFVDPSLGGGTAAQEAFWSYFGCTFVPGSPAATGNVTQWTTHGAMLPATFAYDYRGGPDDLVGSLLPGAADTLIVDQAGAVRGVVLDGPAGSTRVYATVLLGGATETAVTRAEYIDAIVDRFDSIVSALSVSDMRVRVEGGVVSIEGRLSGYGGETVTLTRWSRGAPTAVDIDVTGVGGAVLLRAADRPPAGRTLYRLEAGTGSDARLLWRTDVDVTAGVRPLAFVTAYPNPARGVPRIVIESDADAPATIDFYDVAGRLVASISRTLAAGETTVAVPELSNLVSGVYFARVESHGRTTTGKLHILR